MRRFILLVVEVGLFVGGIGAFAISAYSIWRRDYGPALCFLVLSIWADHLLWRGRNS